MAQDAGAASAALFVEQAEASVADKTTPRHATRASRRVPGMRRAGNMAGPGMGKVYSLCTTMNSSAIVPCCKCKIEIWVALSEFPHRALTWRTIGGKCPMDSEKT
jgi:hypothetical protein